MKIIINFIVVMTVVAVIGVVNAIPAPAARQLPGQEVSVLRNDQLINTDNYNYVYELDNGVKVQESGFLKDENTLSATGQFTYVSPEGQQIRLTYIADENGFQPQGDHLPTPPPIPDAIQRALAYLATARPQTRK